MSEQTRKSAEEATKHLQSAEQSLKQAGESAKRIWRWSHYQEDQKLGGDVAETRQESRRNWALPKKEPNHERANDLSP